MNYINTENIRRNAGFFAEYCNLLTEYGYDTQSLKADVDALQKNIDDAIEKAQQKINELSLCEDEPDDYEKIVAASKGGNSITPVTDLRNKIKGALIARLAGCVLGAPVENWSIEHMKKKAAYEGLSYPPQKYWQQADRAWAEHCYTRRDLFTESKMEICPSDDDITYTFMGLLIMEKYGKNFTTENVGELWKNNLPFAYTAEEIALDNLRNNVKAEHCAEINNPYSNLIGALIRADGFAYACAGNPHLAAKLGYYDAYISHRRNGIYGEMLFAAAIAAAFTTNDCIEAIRIGLNEIPQKSMLYKDIRWALDNLNSIKTYEDARTLVDTRFKGQSNVHTNNNACLIVFALALGDGDVTKAITNAVAMGLDNDCTAATVGSITGAVAGFDSIDEKWYKAFNGKVKTYIADYEFFEIEDAVDRFLKLNSQ